MKIHFRLGTDSRMHVGRFVSLRGSDRGGCRYFGTLPNDSVILIIVVVRLNLGHCLAQVHCKTDKETLHGSAALVSYSLIVQHHGRTVARSIDNISVSDG